VPPRHHDFDASDGERLVAAGERALPLLERAGLQAGERALDVGCGPGVAVAHAAAHLAGGRVTGIDPSGEMIRMARERSLGATNVTLECAPVEAMPLDDATIDVAWALNSLHHWRDLAAGLAEVRRVLRAGGRFLVVEQQPHERRALDDAHTGALVAALRAAGFDVTDVDAYDALGESHTFVRALVPATG
jgi:ubiquinone/menaquinone biosynthesis C-methylase UbiE